MTTQKIQNKKLILLYAKLTVVFILCNVFIISLLSLLKLSGYNFIYITIVFLIILCLQFILLLKLRYFEYENSGEVIIVRNCHFWDMKRFIPPLEFPKEKLADYDIHKTFLATKMELKLKS